MREESLAKQEGVQEAGHQLLELKVQVIFLHHSGEHRCIETHHTVGRQHNWVSEGAQEVDEGGQKVIDWDGFHGRPAEKQATGLHSEACDLSGAVGQVLLRDSVFVEDPLLTDSGQLDDVTP